MRRVAGRAAIALLVAGIAAPLFAPGVARAQEPDATVSVDRLASSPALIRGGAQAVAVRLVPYLGVPGFSGALGITTAQVDSGTAAASAGAADLGLAGTLINASAPGEKGKDPPLQLPEPISASSGRTEQAERYPVQPPQGLAPGAQAPTAPPPGSGAHEIATATEDPPAALGSVTGPELNVPGVLRITGGTSRSAADPTRAVSEVTLGRLALGEDAVVLSGLRWNALKRPGKPAEQSFALGSMTVSGQSMPVESSAEIAAAFAAANTALEPTGLTIAVPQVVGNAGEAAVAPLVLQARIPQSLVEPGAQASTVTKPLLLSVAKAVLDAYPDAAAAQIVVNALVGASSGRSGGRLEFGGVSARADLLPASPTGPAAPALLPPAAAAVPVVPPVLPGSIPVPASTIESAPLPQAAPERLPNTTAPADAAAPPRPFLAQPSSAQSDSSGGRGAAALALGVGLALLLALAAADRMRAGA